MLRIAGKIRVVLTVHHLILGDQLKGETSAQFMVTGTRHTVFIGDLVFYCLRALGNFRSVFPMVTSLITFAESV